MFVQDTQLCTNMCSGSPLAALHCICILCGCRNLAKYILTIMAHFDMPILEACSTPILYRVTDALFCPKWTNEPKLVLGMDLNENFALGSCGYVNEI